MWSRRLSDSTQGVAVEQDSAMNVYLSLRFSQQQKSLLL